MIAVIDIGSNSVRLMIWADGKILEKRVNTTRLGENLSSTGFLKQEAIERTEQAVLEFYSEAKKRGAEVFAFATAAVRSSKNGGELVKRVLEHCRLEIDVVSGEREAQLGLLGVLGQADGGVIDIGGASTEIVFRKEAKTVFSVSLPLGAVRLFESCREDVSLLDAAIDERLKALDGVHETGTVYAIGGTATTLASVALGLEFYDAERIQDFPLSFSKVEALSDRLFSLSPEKRAELPGMDKRRADIIASGAYLLEKIMQKLSLDVIFTSDRDNLEGYLIERGLV